MRMLTSPIRIVSNGKPLGPGNQSITVDGNELRDITSIKIALYTDEIPSAQITMIMPEIDIECMDATIEVQIGDKTYVLVDPARVTLPTGPD